MKWTNKGHEYDEMYKNIEKKKKHPPGELVRGNIGMIL